MAERQQAFDQHSQIIDSYREQFNNLNDDYYSSLKDEFSEYAGLNLRDEDYNFIKAIRPVIESSEDPQFEKEKLGAARLYSSVFQVPFGTAYLNLENYHQEWIGQNFVKKTGFQAVWDSLKLNFVSGEYNRLSKELARTGGNDPHLLQAVEEHEQRVNQLRDRAPKIWQEEYARQGGWDDVGKAIGGISRTIGTMLAENAGHIVSGMATAALAGTGVGLLANAARLAPAVSKLLVAGASRAGIAGSTYNSSWGIKYREMTNEGIPHDIAHNYSRIDALLEGLIEGGLGGVEAAGARAFIPQAVRSSTNRMFISGKMSLAARGALNWLKQGVEEGSEEFLQGLSSGDQFNRAADAANSRREELLRRIVSRPFDEIRQDLERELENHPEVNKKEWGDILNEAFDGAIGGFLIGIVLGLPVEFTNHRNNVRSASMLAGMAQNAVSKEELKDQVNRLIDQGASIPLLDGMKTDDVSVYLDKLYDVQQSRLTPEQREEKRKQAEEAATLAELTDYSNAEIEERVEKQENGEEITSLSLVKPDEEERGNTGFDHYTTENEDGSINGRFVLGDTTKEENNQYGYINYTETDGNITVDSFSMMHGHEDLRQELYDRFAADPNIRGKEIIWNVPEELRHVKDQLINNNRRGPKFGLVYHEQGSEPVISNDSRKIARQFKQHMNPNTAPIEVALAAEVFNAFYRRRGESIGGAMNRLLGSITNDPKAHSQIETAAQTTGDRVKGATWLDQTAEGLRNFIYYNKNSADPSTVVHELGHIVERDFTDAERRIAARALNGYKLKNGTVVYFNENNNQWTDEQREAFAEALENYLTNGKAPNEQIKPLFEKIKEFMKRIYKFFTGWTELSPQVEDFYKSLLSGELVDRARAEEAGTKSAELAEQEKRGTDTDDELDNFFKSLSEEQEKREEFINDPTIPIEEKTEAVIEAAGDALFQITDEDQAHIPTAALLERARLIPDIAERQRVMDEIRRLRELYAGTEAEFKAPNGKNSLLLDSLGEEKGKEAWYAARTEGFKKWFGDWERAARIAEIEGIEAKEYKPDTKVNKENAKEFIQKLEAVKKSFTTDLFIPEEDETKKTRVTHHHVDNIRKLELDIIFSGNAAGGYRSIFAPDKPNLISNLREIFNTSIYAYSSNYINIEPRKDKTIHKNKPNIVMYHHFINKINDGLNIYYVRFTVEELKNESQLHSAHITDVEVIKNISQERGTQSGKHRHDTSHLVYDKNLVYFFNSVKGNVSKVVDENGEPLAVFHGGTFKKSDIPKEGMHFGTEKSATQRIKDKRTKKDTELNAVFLSVKNPVETPDTYIKDWSKTIEWAKNKGHDGILYINKVEDKGNISYIAFDPNQIKSATDNTGTYDPQNPSILFQLSDENQEIVNAAKAVYGTTNDIREAGYLLTDGTMLDFSEKKDGGEPGRRSLDHNEMSHFEHNDKEYTPGVSGFLNMGNIRLMPEIGGIDLARLPLDSQIPTLKKYIQFFNGKVIIDFSSKENRAAENSVEYGSGIKAIRIINDIVNYYEKGIVPVSILFQIGDVELIEEAAGMENGLQFMNWLKFMGESYYPQDLRDTWNAQEDRSYKHMNEVTIAWCDAFVQYSKQAVAASEKIDAITGEATEETANKKITPADKDHEFLQIINKRGEDGTGELENFMEVIAGIIHEGAYDEKSGKLIDTLNHKLKHKTWQTVINAKGKIGDKIQRKQLLTLIRKAPRDYRAIYAQVMGREDLSVSQEDTTAEALRYRIKDSRAEGIENLTPEKLRQLAETLDREDFAEKVRTGRAKIDDPAEKAYIKWLQEQLRKAEEALEELQAEKQEDDNYIERQIGKEFNDKFNNVLALRETIANANDKLERALKAGRKDASEIAHNLRLDRATYDTLVEDLKALARTHQLEIDVMEILNNQRIREAVKAARTEAVEKQQAKLDAVLEEFKDYRKSAKTEATLLQRLARKAARQELQAHIDAIKEQREKAKEITRAKKAVIKRIFKKPNPREVNADQGFAIAVIQDFAEPSFYKGINAFIGEIIEHDLPVAFRRWKIEARFRHELIKDKRKDVQEKMTRLFEKEKLEDLTKDEKKYLAKKIAAEDWVEELGLNEIAERRRKDYPMTEEQKQLIKNYLPSDIYYRIMDKPFSQWTLSEAEELAKIIDDLAVRGKNIYKGNIEAENKRIEAYKDALMQTFKTVKPGKEKDLEKYAGGVEGTTQDSALRGKLRSRFSRYSDMNMYRFARMIDNNSEDGKNMAFLFKAREDAREEELRNTDKRTEPVLKLLNDLGIKVESLWEKTEAIDLGEGDRKNHQFTKAELLGFLAAIKNPYSREAVMFGNMLSEKEREFYQKENLGRKATQEEMAGLIMSASARFEKVEAAANKLLKENPDYQKIIDAIAADFKEGGKRLSSALVRYNNTFMAQLEDYFPMIRNDRISSHESDSKELHEMMGKAGGAFNLYVEKGMTKERTEIPIEYQRGIELDLLKVWQDSVNKEEHFIAFGQWVKDANKIYKSPRGGLRRTIHDRYGQEALKFIDDYISEQANPNSQKAEENLKGVLKTLRGNYPAAVLGWRTSSIVTQLVTSPFPFFTYINPHVYMGHYVNFMTHQNSMWEEICELSTFMKHRNMNMVVDYIKEQAKLHHDKPYQANIAKISKLGMAGLEWADRVSVAPGWYALYKQEQKRLTDENAGGKLTAEDIKVKAAQYADTITKNIQPSSDPAHLAKMFKGNSTLLNSFLQFQQALNTIWQMNRYDMPYHFNSQRKMTAIRNIISMTMCGIFFGLIRSGFDDDDDGKDKAKKIAFYGSTQFLESVPLLGGEVSRAMELAITGKYPYTGGLNILPVLDKGKQAVTTAIKGVQQADAEMIAKSVGQGIMMYSMYHGLPSQGIRDFGKLTGIGDGDGKLDFDLGALGIKGITDLFK